MEGSSFWRSGGRPCMRRQPSIVDSDDNSSRDAHSPCSSTTEEPPSPQPRRPQWRPEEIERHMEELEKTFFPLVSDNWVRCAPPGVWEENKDHTCVFRPSQQNQFYNHYPHSVEIARRYAQVRRLLVERAVLQFRRDCKMRMGQLLSFTNQLQRMYADEFALLDQKRNSDQHISGEESRLEYLVSLCDDMRNHLNHWTSLSNKLSLNKWLRPVRHSLTAELTEVHRQLVFLIQEAIHWMHELIQLGIQVFAITPFHQIPQNILWNLTRGIEEFNSVLRIAGKQITLKTLRELRWTEYPRTHPLGCSNLPLLATIRPISLATLLNQIASHRAILVAELIYELFSSNDTIVQMLQDDDESPQVVEEKVVLNRHISSLLLYVKMEEDFATQILSSFATNTNMLRKQMVKTSQEDTATAHNSRDRKFKPRQPYDVSSFFHEPPPETPEPEKPKSEQTKRKRGKSVRFTDAVNSSAINHYKSRYLNLLWYHLNWSLLNLFHEPSWNSIESSRYKIGDIRLLSTNIITVISKTLHQLSKDEQFSAMLRNSLLSTSRKIQLCAITITTDREFRRMQVSTVSEPKESHGGGVSETTRTLINALKPNIAFTETVCRQLIINDSSLDNTLVTLAQRPNLEALPSNLLYVCTLLSCYTSWFANTVGQSTLNWRVQPYVNLVHVDVLLVKELLSRLLGAVEPVTGQVSDRCQMTSLQHAVTSLKAAAQSVHVMSSEIERLFTRCCRHVCNRHWRHSFPTHGIWRSKSAVPSTRPQEYAQKAIVTIIEPVARAAAASLRVNSQVKVVASVLTCLFETWMNYILHNRVKFTVVGAYQLSVDFESIQKWLTSNYCHLDPEAVSQLVNLTIFREANAVINILQDDAPAPPIDLKAKSSQSLYNEHTRNTSSDYYPRLRGGTAISAPTLQQYQSGDNTCSTTGGWVNDFDDSSLHSTYPSSEISGRAERYRASTRERGSAGRYVHLQREHEWHSLRLSHESPLCPSLAALLCSDVTD